jgi:malonate-semialdehyde dehydrogenase (acetylating)/methylmalonate-semialdehyde dehydrogenase
MTVKQCRNYINGEWVDSKATQTVDVRNPATGEIIGKVPLCGPSDVDAAVQAANQAFPDWRGTPPATRARVLFRLREVLEANFEEFSRVATMEAGKTIDEARAEMRRAFDMVERACGIPGLMLGSNLEDVARGVDCVAIRQPLGVFAAINPFNFPAMVPFWFWPFAVACGNTFVLKPSEQSPLCLQRILEVIDAEGIFPPGVLNLVNGGKDAVNAILEHPVIKGVSFVGSTNVARLVYRKCGETGKRVQAFGGAKNFMVVMPDADLKMTIPALVSSVYGCAGQRCLAGSVVQTVGAIHDPFVAAMTEAAAKFKVGNGLDESVQMGPVISAAHRARVLAYIEQGIAEGADLILDGRNPKVAPGGENGYFIGPCIFDNVKPHMTIAKEEIFGPVLAIMPLDSFDEALDIMNANPYGNATSIFTSSGKAAREFTYRADASMVGVNIGLAAPMSFFPFGGAKGSFFGDLKAHGPDAIEFFTDRKVVTTRW